jgi:hypothetical protein
MVMNFLKLYGLEERKKVHSRLAEIDEKYRVLTGQGEDAKGEANRVDPNEI